MRKAVRIVLFLSGALFLLDGTPPSLQVSFADQSIPSPGTGPHQIYELQAFEPSGPPPDPEGMVTIPGGEFEMGDLHDDLYSAMPVHTVYLDAFYIDIYETSNQEYADVLNWAWSQGLVEVTNGEVHKPGELLIPYCQTDGGSHWSRITWDGLSFGVEMDKGEHPMLKVSWYGAAVYSNWRSMLDGLTPSYDTATWLCDFDASGYRLPSEAEWEKAARGGLHDPHRRYPWGDSFNGSTANYWSSGDPYELGARPLTSPAGYFNGHQSPSGPDMANGYGLYDIGGNVWEWCNDWYDSNFYAASPDDNPRGPSTGLVRVLRGGSWARYAGFLRCAIRDFHAPDYQGTSGGFRLVLDVD